MLGLLRLIWTVVRTFGTRFMPFILKRGGAFFSWLSKRGWVVWLIAALVQATGSVLKRIFLFLGVSLVASKITMPVLREYVIGPLLSLPPEWRAFLALAKVDQAVGVILSAVFVVLVARIRVKPKPNFFSGVGG